jgi:hypothetical protein
VLCLACRQAGRRAKLVELRADIRLTLDILKTLVELVPIRITSEEQGRLEHVPILSPAACDLAIRECALLVSQRSAERALTDELAREEKA